MGTEQPTIASVREDLGLRLHANVVGGIGEQSFIYKPSARLIDAFNVSMVHISCDCAIDVIYRSHLFSNSSKRKGCILRRNSNKIF